MYPIWDSTAPMFESAPAPDPEDSWRHFAACYGLPQEWFFAEDHKHESGLLGLAVCLTCPVSTQCLEDALRANVKFGLWGGMTTRERWRERVRRRHRR